MHPAEQFDEDVPVPPALSWSEARQEDAYWHRNYWLERYYDCAFEYEDYAPAYCVGYVGCAQYGGGFADAERSLCANWERIRGESRLSLEQAMPAMRAAWERMARRRRRQVPAAVHDPRFDFDAIAAPAPRYRRAAGAGAAVPV